LNGTDNGSRTYDLSRFGITEVHSAMTYLGHLVLVSENAVLLFDINKLSEPLLRIGVSQGPYISDVSVAETPESRVLLVCEPNGLFGIDLLDGEGVPSRCYEPAAGKTIHSSLGVNGWIYILENDESNGSSRLLRTQHPPRSLSGETVTTFDGPCSRLTPLDDCRFLFWSDQRVFVCDFQSGALKFTESPVPLTRSCIGYSAEMNRAFLAAGTTLWRVELGQSDLPVSQLTSVSIGEPCLSAKGYDVVVTHSRGVMVLDPFGTVRWDSSRDFITSESDGFAPQIYGDSFTSTSIGRRGGTLVRLHRLSRPNDFREFPFEERLLCRPVLYLGRLIVVRQVNGSVVLNVTDLSSN
jgi:hypothetical protein